VYVLVRTDIPLRQQLVQSVHAGIQATALFPSREPWLVVCAVPDAATLRRAKEDLAESDIDSALFYEPDNELGYTALATAPITREKRKVLSRYPLWSE
jgi:hypothetical protein